MILSTSQSRCHQANSSIFLGSRSKTQNRGQNRIHPSLTLLTAKCFPLKRVFKKRGIMVPRLNKRQKTSWLRIKTSKTFFDADHLPVAFFYNIILGVLTSDATQRMMFLKYFSSLDLIWPGQVLKVLVKLFLTGLPPCYASAEVVESIFNGFCTTWGLNYVIYVTISKKQNIS